MNQNQEQKDFNRAMRALMERRFDAAVELWQVFVERYPGRATAHANLALCLNRCSRHDEALIEARRAHELLQNRATHLALIETLSTNGLDDELEREAAEHARLYPDDSIGHGLWGEAAYKRGDLKAAEEHLLRSVDIYPRQGGAWAVLGQVYMDEWRFEEAVDAWGKSMAHADTRPMPRDEAKFESLMGMGWSLLMMGKPDRSLVLAEQAEKLNVYPAEAQGLRARCLLILARAAGLRVAEDAFRNGYASDYLRARVAFEYAALGKPNEAKEHLNKMGVAPDIYARNLRAATLAALGCTYEAVAEFGELDGEFEPHVRYNGLAIAYRVAGDYARAEEMSLKALEIRRDEIILATLASQYVDLKRYDEAEPLLEEAIRLNPDLAQARSMLGFTYASNGNALRAKEQLRAVLSSEHARESEKAEAADLLGWIEGGEQVSADYKERGLVPVQYEELERVMQRSRRQDTLRYEEQCAKLARDRRGKLRWTGVQTNIRISHHGSKREIDVFGVRKTGSSDILGVGECKMKTGSMVNHDEMRELVEKMSLVLCEERHNKERKVEGCFFSSLGYDKDALELARKHRIRTFLALPQKGWQKRADWTMRAPREI